MVLTLGGGATDPNLTGDDWWVVVLERFGLPIALLAVILWAGFTRKWVFGYQLTAAENREAEVRSEVEKLRAQIEQMHREVLAREQQLSTGVASRIYESAALYRERDELATTTGDRIDELGTKLDDLVRRMEGGGGPAGPSGSVRGAGRRDRSGTSKDP